MGITIGVASEVGAAVGDVSDCTSSSVMDSEFCKCTDANMNRSALVC